MIIQTFENILNANTRDPDDFRRRKLLNIFLIGLTIIGALTTVITLVSPAASPQLPFLGIVLILSNGLIYIINRFASGPVAAGIFLLMLIFIITFGDAPQEVVEGRTLFFLSVPIIASSILAPSFAAFVIAGAISLLSAYLAVSNDLPVNTVGILGFFTVAFGTWLSARPLEAALKEVRILNQDLDRRVSERTKELKSANERLRELDQLKNKFISEVSHELRTPVSNLNIYLEILESGSRPEHSERFMDVLREETGRLTELVNSVLEISNIDLGAFSSIDERATNLNVIIGQIVEAQRLHASAKGLNLQLSLSEQPAFIQATPEQLKRICTNVIGNAMKYTQEGSVHVRTEISNGHALLSIRDTGIGISPSDLGHIFDRFYRGENVSKLTFPGSGLGLAIARELAVLLGGNIVVDSSLDEGTTVVVSLPLIVE